MIRTFAFETMLHEQQVVIVYQLDEKNRLVHANLLDTGGDFNIHFSQKDVFSDMYRVTKEHLKKVVNLK